jgi:hypothetical protein
MCNRLFVTGAAFCVTAMFAVSPVQAGQTPGVSSPWNGPWGGGYQTGEAYSPLANPYVQAGYPVAGSQYGGGQQWQASSPGPDQAPQSLPGGGYLLPPASGGGILPGAYGR